MKAAATITRSTTGTDTATATTGMPWNGNIAKPSPLKESDPAMYHYIWQDPLWRTIVDDTTLGEAD